MIREERRTCADFRKHSGLAELETQQCCVSTLGLFTVADLSDIYVLVCNPPVLSNICAWAFSESCAFGLMCLGWFYCPLMLSDICVWGGLQNTRVIRRMYKICLLTTASFMCDIEAESGGSGAGG